MTAFWKRLRFLLLGVLVSAAAILFSGPEFRLSSGTIDFSAGADYSVCPGMRESVERHLDSILAADVPLFMIRFGEIKRALLSGEPGIRTASFRLDFNPLPHLTVVAEPRVPEIVLHWRDSDFYMDGDGVVFPAAFCPEEFAGVSRAGHNLREIDLRGDESLTPGKPLPSPLREKLLASISILDRASEIRFDDLRLMPAGGWRLETGGGFEVRLGGSDELERKLAILPPLLRAVRERTIPVAYIDLTRENMPVVRLADEAGRRNSGQFSTL